MAQNNNLPQLDKISAIIGLGNPGNKFHYNRHNIGFRVLDALADKYNGQWRTKDMFEMAQISINGNPIILVKPQTFMNASGNVLPYLTKQGIKAQNILVVHDELEQPFGKLKLKVGGSHKGHNGLKSIIANIGADFARLGYGIGRPENKEDVPDYVLSNFSQSATEVDQMIDKAVELIEKTIST